MSENASNTFVTLNTEARIPQVGLGVWQAGGATKRAVLGAVQAGYRHVDTARIYGNEANVAQGLRESGVPREDLFITTKLWNQEQGYDKALAAFDASLLRMKLDYVDLYLIHWPVPGERLESWRALEKLFADKRARAIGVSNFLLPHLQELLGVAKVVPAVNQIELTPFLQRSETTAFCKQHGIVLEAYSPLTRGQKLADPLVVELARQVQRSPAQVLLRWNVQHGRVVLPKSVTAARIEENAALFDFSLSAEQMAQLDALEEGLVTGWDPAGEN